MADRKEVLVFTVRSSGGKRHVQDVNAPVRALQGGI